MVQQEELKQDLFYKKLIDCQAIQKGHFKLSSGKHTDTYYQLSKLFEYPSLASAFCDYFIFKNEVKEKKIDVVVGLAMGSILFAYELCKQLNPSTKFIFCERENGKFTFRRGFDIPQCSNVYILEDVITTGKSIIEANELVKLYNPNKIYNGCLINRSIEKNEFFDNLEYLIKVEEILYDEEECLLCKQNLPITSPGSRFLK